MEITSIHNDATKLTEELWNDSYARDLYFGGELYYDVADENRLLQERVTRRHSVPGPPT